jgi:hypothetical protein
MGVQQPFYFRHLPAALWLTIGLIVAASAARPSADDWPEWRGKGRTGVWNERGLVDRLPEQGPPVAWRTPIHAGYAGPAVAGGRVFVTDARPAIGDNGEKRPRQVVERILALDERTGRVLWTHEWQTNREMGCASAAMKIVSPQVLHKTDVGGVRLGLRGEEDVARAFMEITSSVRRLAPSAWIAGVSIQEMVTGGRELIVGMSRDPQFGPLLMFGLGGIYVEVLKDVSFRVAPVSRRDAEEMVREIRAWPLLAAYRGSEPADEGAIVEALLRVSRLSCDFPEIQELDINPLLVLPKGKGIRAIDCRMTIAEAP